MKSEGAEAVCSCGLLSVQVSGMGFVAGPPARSESVVGSADVRVAKAVKIVVARSMMMKRRLCRSRSGTGKSTDYIVNGISVMGREVVECVFFVRWKLEINTFL